MKMKKTLATLALGLTCSLAPIFAQNANGVIRKVDVKYQDSSKAERKTNRLYGNIFTASDNEEGELKNSIEGKGMNIYFQNDEHKLDSGDIKDVAQYTGIMGDYSGSIKIESSADANASEEYNVGLSSRRAMSVKDELQKRYPKANIETIALGEDLIDGTEDNYAERRKVKVTVDNVISHNLIDKDVNNYLIDCSGSTAEVIPGTKIRKINAIWGLEFPIDSDVYTFSGRSKSSKLGATFPNGPTPLYNAISEMIEKTDAGEEIKIFTDGKNSENIKSYSPQHVINAAMSKGIKLSIVGVGIPKDNEYIYEKMSNSTGGKYAKIK